MTQEKLKQYLALKNEIKVIQNRINKLETTEDNIVLDTISGSTRYFPYTKRTMVIEGCDLSKVTRINNLKQLLINRTEKAYIIIKEIEDFIGSIEDSIVRQILLLKYIEGCPWKVVSTKVYGYPCADRARVKILRYFEKNY